MGLVVEGAFSVLGGFGGVGGFCKVVLVLNMLSVSAFRMLLRDLVLVVVGLEVLWPFCWCCFVGVFFGWIVKLILTMILIFFVWVFFPSLYDLCCVVALCLVCVGFCCDFSLVCENLDLDYPVCCGFWLVRFSF